jgi:hypothetical protein
MGHVTMDAQNAYLPRSPSRVRSRWRRASPYQTRGKSVKHGPLALHQASAQNRTRAGGGDGWKSNPPRTPHSAPQTVLKTADLTSTYVHRDPLQFDRTPSDSRTVRLCPRVSVKLAVFLAVIDTLRTASPRLGQRYARRLVSVQESVFLGPGSEFSPRAHVQLP